MKITLKEKLDVVDDHRGRAVNPYDLANVVEGLDGPELRGGIQEPLRQLQVEIEHRPGLLGRKRPQLRGLAATRAANQQNQPVVGTVLLNRADPLSQCNGRLRDQNGPPAINGHPLHCW